MGYLIYWPVTFFVSRASPASHLSFTLGSLPKIPSIAGSEVIDESFSEQTSHVGIGSMA